MDVSSLVKSINSCFEDAAGLVRRIRDNREEPLNDDAAVNELIDSLELGPVVINGYFRSDLKRFGDQYITGDMFAREQLKDVLIHLQMTVLSTLSTVLMLEKDLDYATIQAASDDCRVNAGVSLGQLSQRLADPTQAQKFSGYTTSFPFTLPVPLLKRSQSVSSHTSEGPRTPTTPELEEAMAHLDYPGRLPGFVQAPDSQAKALAVLQGAPASPKRKSVAVSSHSSVSTWDRRNTLEETNRSKPVSLLSEQDAMVISPVSPASIHDQWGRRPPSFSSSLNSGLPQERRPSELARERYGPDDYNDTKESVYQIGAVRSQPNPMELTQSRERTSSIASQATSNEAYMDPAQFSRPDTSLRFISSRTIPANVAATRSSTALNAPIPVHENAPSLLSPPLPLTSPSRRTTELEPLRPGARKILGDIDPYIDRFVNEPVMPVENNTLGYCKGAFRLQIGLQKKAFGINQRPAGMHGLLPYWRCEKCQFEGPVKLSNRPGQKPEKIFDPSIREFDGIRFKWAFLAKCHVPQKSSTSSNITDGSSGSFGCIFCTAEARARQWNIAGMSSVGKGKNAQRPTGSDSTPIFGNSNSFMEHLQFHRQMNYWPNREMQRKMKCIVGRVADVGEDFEVNFMPLEVEMEA